ncbi:hypothetical protein JCM3765_003850 [Sporobolomyces pararoseus]
MFRQVYSPLKALSILATPLSTRRTFRVLPPVSSLPMNSFAQLLSIERTTAEHSFSEIVSQLELKASGKWVCRMKVSDFKAVEGKDLEGKEVEVIGEGDTSLEATNDAAGKVLDTVDAQHKEEKDTHKIEEKKKE